jgi:hypothetical protein
MSAEKLERVEHDTKWSNTQLFVLAYLHHQVKMWVTHEWNLPGFVWDPQKEMIKKQIMQELDDDDELTMEIFEGGLLQCQQPFTEDACRNMFLSHLRTIERLLQMNIKSTSEAWRRIAKTKCVSQGLVTYDFNAVIREIYIITKLQNLSSFMEQVDDEKYDRWVEIRREIDQLIASLQNIDKMHNWTEIKTTIEGIGTSVKSLNVTELIQSTVKGYVDRCVEKINESITHGGFNRRDSLLKRLYELKMT